MLIICSYKKIFFVFISEPIVISPARWLISCLIPIPIAVFGYRKKSVNLSGALLGMVVAFVLTLSNYCFLADLLVFFLSSSKATRFRPHLKRKFEEDFKEGTFYFSFIICYNFIVLNMIKTAGINI